MTVLWQDIRYGLRLLQRRPGFAVAVILCLGLGIGGVTAVLSVINGVTVRFMPYKQPDRLVVLVASGIFDSRTPVAPAGCYLDWKAQNRSFSDMAVYQRHEPHSRWSGWAQTQEDLMDLQGLRVTPSYFSVLGMRTLLGRALADGDQGQPAIVLSYRVWRDRFAEDRAIIGQTVVLAGKTREVVGVAAPGYRFFPTLESTSVNKSVDYWIPVGQGLEHEARDSWNYAVLARLKPAVTLAQAQTDMDRLTQLQRERYPDSFSEDVRMLVAPLPKTLIGPIRSATVLTLVAAAFVLLIACANVVNLLLVSSMKRRTEIAVRSALGSSRRRVVRQLICENAIIVLLGGALGIALAQGGMNVLLAMAPRSLPGLDEIGLDTRVLTAAVAVTLITTVVVGLIPGVLASRLNLASALKGFGPRATSGFGEQQTLRGIVVSEIVLSFILVIGATLLIRSYGRLMDVELGFQPSGILTLRLSGPNLSNRHDALIERLGALPGVKLVASSTGLPLSGQPSDARLVSPVPAEALPESYPVSYIRTVSPNYFDVLGTPLVGGRRFTRQDNAESSPVVIVNKALAQRLWPKENPIGQLMDFGEGTRVFYDGSGETLVQRRVVGVARDTRYEGPDQAPLLEAFIPFAQRTRKHITLSVALRCQGDPARLMKTARQEAMSVDGSLKVESMGTIEGFHAELTAHRRFLMAMLVVFATIAFTLAVIGIYGVIAFTVSMRVREMGIRIALGAQRGTIRQLVMRQAIRLIVTGVGLGLLGTLALRQVIASQLFGISPLDPLTLGISLLLIVLVPLLACYLPARRAAKVDPMVALRYE